ncbi:MAG: neutral/alkaline non-lysosomal ceramidase N-terminal domain-containing protein [Parabacteroides sp.]
MKQSASASEQSFRVGAGRVEITPEASLFPFRSAHEQHPYVGVHDSLFARVIVMESEGKRAVLITLDETSVPIPEQLRQRVAAVSGTTQENILLCVSHTHSTLHPNERDTMMRHHLEHIERGVAEATRQAIEALTPACVAFGRTQAYANINNGEIIQSNGQYYEEGFSDKTLDLIRFTTPQGEPLALVMNYATHAEVMFRSVSGEGGYEVSGDLPGRVAWLMERHPEGAPIVLTTAGAEADQQPLFTSSQRTTTQGFVDQGAAGWAIVDVLARRVVDAAVERLRKMPQEETFVTLRTASGKAYVPGQRWHRMANGEAYAEDTDEVAIPVQMIQLNQVTMAAVGADLAAAIGKSLRDSFPLPQTMLITMRDGSVGYILTDEAYLHPVHGVMGSPVKPGFAERALKETFKNLMQ